jgi:hypothetical protein
MKTQITNTINNNTILFYKKVLLISLATCFLLLTTKGQDNNNINFFSCNINNKVAQISWQTTNEKNVSYFEIQKSSNGVDFTTIATITAVGKLNTNTNYVQRDELLLFLGVKIFYRLKTINQNLKEINSQIISSTVNEKIINNLKTWPIPFANQLNLSFFSNENTNTVIKIVDLKGTIISSTTCIIKKGQNNIILNQAQQIPTGTYALLIYFGNNQVESIKIIK